MTWKKRNTFENDKTIHFSILFFSTLQYVFSAINHRWSQIVAKQKRGTRGAVKCVTDVPTIFWSLSLPTTLYTHGKMKSVCFIADDYLNAGDIALFSGGLWVDRCFSEPVSIKGLGLKVKYDRL